MNLKLCAGKDLSLLLFRPHHSPALFRLVETNRSHLESWLPWIREIRDVESMDRYIRRALTAYSCGREAHFGIWNRGVLAGSVTVERIDIANRVAEIGYWLGRGQTGQGLMTRSVRCVAEYLFRQRKMHRVEIRVDASNHSSRKVALRSGFREEGLLRDAYRSARGVNDVAIYGLLAHEWAETKDGP
ncbi:ribosomal-protein-serine acetyltransferase [Melghirimyces profundicolus]|uniref:Ribosomal-protein-serine acetyltransferase n=1 Tax=Melghirimyces profundicolus TaxID=1242148 RepID=A0A2T6AZE3_9BACL|nr:GNAT family protein [Melghirimyces profundicolus]PTX49153.1 ribosomal-protein-serine acetyltransferase [Melghirimyces profundicolus]